MVSSTPTASRLARDEQRHTSSSLPTHGLRPCVPGVQSTPRSVRPRMAGSSHPSRDANPRHAGRRLILLERLQRGVVVVGARDRDTFRVGPFTALIDLLRDSYYVSFAVPDPGTGAEKGVLEQIEEA